MSRSSYLACIDYDEGFPFISSLCGIAVTLWLNSIYKIAFNIGELLGCTASYFLSPLKGVYDAEADVTVFGGSTSTSIVSTVVSSTSAKLLRLTNVVDSLGLANNLGIYTTLLCFCAAFCLNVRKRLCPLNLKTLYRHSAILVGRLVPCQLEWDSIYFVTLLTNVGISAHLDQKLSSEECLAMKVAL